MATGLDLNDNTNGPKEIVIANNLFKNIFNNITIDGLTEIYKQNR